MRRARFLTRATAALLLAGGALGQTTFFEVEPNDTKAEATPAFGMLAGDLLRIDIGCPPTGDHDIFRVRTAPLAPGIWRHRLVPQNLPLGNYPALLGRTQFAGIVDPASTTVLQEGSDLTTPQRFVQWYGFGTAEELYVDLDDTSDCRTIFELQLETAPVAPTPVAVTLPPGSVLYLEPTPSSPSTDLDLVVLDADFDVLPGSGVRRGIWSQLPQGVAHVTEGTYYIGVSQGPLLTSEPAAIDDDIDYDSVFDLRGAAASGRRDVGATYELNVSGMVNIQGTFTEPYELQWFQVDVDVGQNVATFCPGDGSAGACPCGPSAAGQAVGCANSTGRGARLVASGSLRYYDVRYSLRDLPPGTLAIVFAGLTTAAPMPTFAGNLCLGPGAIRLDPVTADALGSAEVLSSSRFFTAGFLAGTTVVAQAAYRDAVAAPGCRINLTNGESVTVRP